MRCILYKARLNMNNSTIIKIAKAKYNDYVVLKRTVYFDFSLPFSRMLHFDPALNNSEHSYIHVGFSNFLLEDALEDLTLTERCEKFDESTIWHDEEVLNSDYENSKQFLNITNINIEMEAKKFIVDFCSKYPNQIRFLEKAFYTHLYFEEFSIAIQLKNNAATIIAEDSKPRNWEIKILEDMTKFSDLILNNETDRARRKIMDRVQTNRGNLGWGERSIIFEA